MGEASRNPDRQSVQQTLELLGDALADILVAIWRWIALVAAVAVSTCLGITLFVVLVMGLIANNMRGVKIGPFTTTTTTSTPGGTTRLSGDCRCPGVDFTLRVQMLRWFATGLCLAKGHPQVDRH